VTSTLSVRDTTNPYSPTSHSGVVRSAHRLTSNIWSIVVPTVIASVVGSIFLRSYFVSAGDPTGASISAGVTGLVVLPFVLLVRHATQSFRSLESTNIVADGYERALDGIEAEVRPEIERKYADKLNASGLFKRWFLLRRIEREISECVVARSRHITSTTLF